MKRAPRDTECNQHADIPHTTHVRRWDSLSTDAKQAATSSSRNDRKEAGVAALLSPCGASLRGAGCTAAAHGAGSGRLDCVSRARGGEEGGRAVCENVDLVVSASSSSESLKRLDCLVCGVEARALEGASARTVVLGVDASV